MIPFARIVKYGNVLPVAPEVKKLNGSQLHVGLLYSTGNMYMRGQGSNYKLGTGNADNVLNGWVHVPYVVNDVWVSIFGTAIRTNDNKIYYVGVSTAFGISGTSTVWTEMTSILTSGGISISEIDYMTFTGSSPQISTLILMKDGTLYGLGYNYNSVLGVSGIKSTPFIIDTGVSFAAGSQLSSNSFHYIKNGVYYRCGNQAAGNLGAPGNLTVFTPYTFSSPDVKVLGIELFLESTKLLVQEGDGSYALYMSGSNITLAKGDTANTGIIGSTFIKYVPSAFVVAEDTMIHRGDGYTSISYGSGNYFTAGSANVSGSGMGRTINTSNSNVSRGYYGSIEFEDPNVDITKIENIMTQSSSQQMYCIVGGELYWSGLVSYFTDEDAVAPNYKFRKLINYPK